MTSIERAKRFIQGKGRILALTVVPLASLTAISIPASAGTVGPAINVGGLVFNTVGCETGGSGGAHSGSCTISQLAPQNGVTGITMAGSASVGVEGSGGTVSVEFFASGSANGASFGPGSIPLHYDFTVSNSDGNPVAYTLLLDFATNMGDIPETFSGSTSSGVSGSPTANIPESVTVEGYEIELTVTDSSVPENGTILLVTVPAGTSVDVNAIPSSVPEPAAISLVGSALAGLMWWRRRKV